MEHKIITLWPNQADERIAAMAHLRSCLDCQSAMVATIVDGLPDVALPFMVALGGTTNFIMRVIRDYDIYKDHHLHLIIAGV